MDGLVSIVLPVYNGEEFLRESLDSIIDQTYKNWELLILDDCSTDNTPVIAKEYATKDDRIKYIRNEKNLKLPGNLNKGFSLAKGEYLTWTSDDNKYRPIAIEKMLGELNRNSSDLVYASYQVIDESGNNIKVISADKIYTYEYTDETKKYAASIFNYIFIPETINKDLGYTVVQEKIEKLDTSKILCEYSKMVVEKVKACFSPVLLSETEESKQKKHMNQYFSYQFKEDYFKLVGMILEDFSARFVS